MTTVRFRLVLGAAAIVAAGCAQQPSRADRSAPAVATSAPAATASMPARSGPNGVSPELLAFARDQGYRPSVRNGHAIFCREENPTGSNLPVRRCVDAVRLRFEVQQQQQERQRLQQQTPITGLPPGR